MARKPREKRLEERAEYQRAYRARQKAERKPSRDDVARVVLRWEIGRALTMENRKLERLERVVIEGLVEQGFDRDAAKHRFHEIVDRYEDGWNFRLKPHLRPNGDDA
ncbi:hypothetical protein [Lutibaculum baratangense]|nr:hypothetical protein [Lutibaculum baratangense]